MINSLLLVFAAAAGTLAPATPKSNPQAKALPIFMGMNNFVVRYTVEDEALKVPLKLELVRSLQTLGQVFPGDDTKLTAQQKATKYQTGSPIIEVSISTLKEEQFDTPPSYTNLSTIAIDIKVLAGIEIVSNQMKFPCPIWERQHFISAMASKDELIQTATKHVHAMLGQFIRSYHQSNPETSPAPQFFFY